MCLFIECVPFTGNKTATSRIWCTYTQVYTVVGISRSVRRAVGARHHCRLLWPTPDHLGILIKRGFNPSRSDFIPTGSSVRALLPASRRPGRTYICLPYSIFARFLFLFHAPCSYPVHSTLDLGGNILKKGLEKYKKTTYTFFSWR